MGKDLALLRRGYTLIDQNGKFNTRIERYLDLASESRPPAVVSIIGAQSSGKSTLLNHLFRTDFEVMNQANGFGRTTKGIRMAKYQSKRADSPKTPILVADTEGSDGCERKDNLKFEKQTALFTLAVSDVVIINMKCDNVNNDQGGGWALLRTVLEVMVRKFETPRQVRLVFVLRDKNGMAFDKLKTELEGKMGKIWKGIIEQQAPKKDINRHQAPKIPSLEDYFKTEVVTMSHYRPEDKDFKAEVASLKKQILGWIGSGKLPRETIAASGFAAYAKEIWNAIQKDKDLQLPRYSIMVAQVRCKAIADEKYKSFLKDKAWLGIKKRVEESPGVVERFGQGVGSIRKSYLEQYDKEAQHFHHTQRDEYKKHLTEELMKNIERTYRRLVKDMFDATLQSFNEEAVGNDIKSNDFNERKKRLIKEFENQLKGATIGLANRNWESKQTTEQITKLEKAMKSVIEMVAACNEVLNWRKKNRRFFWKRILSIGVHLLAAAVGVAVMILVPGAGIGVGVSALTGATTKIIEELMKNQKPSKNLKAYVHASLKDA